MDKLSNDSIQRFKELYPERFAELQERAEREASMPLVERIAQATRVVHTRLIRKPVEQRIAEVRGNNKHFLVTDSLGKRYFEGALNPEAAVEKARGRHIKFVGPARLVEEYP